jgi:putative glycosyltransferase (TIGR04372 family)
MKSGLFWEVDPEIRNLKSRYESASNLVLRGYYKEGVSIKLDVLRSIYDKQDVVFQNYFPPILHESWFENIGHVISTSYLHQASKIGIVPQGQRYVIARESYQTEEWDSRLGSIIEAIEIPFGIIPLRSHREWHDHLSLSPLVERPEIIKGVNQFHEKCDLMHKVLKRHFTETEFGFIELKSEYESRCLEFFSREFGFNPESDWYCAFHLRESTDANDTKASTLESYLPALYEVVRAGGRVIRFGVGARTHLPPHSSFIDLTNLANKPSFLKLHAFIIKYSRFLLTTHSGPRALAFGIAKPTLNVNVVSLAQNLWFSPMNISLPKHFYHRGNEMSFREILMSRFGYAETGLDDFWSDGVTVRENSSDEILEATREILHSINRGSLFDKYTKTFAQIFEETSAISRGAIANSFLAQMKDRYIN